MSGPHDPVVPRRGRAVDRDPEHCQRLPDHRADPGRRQGRAEDPATRQGSPGDQGAAAGDLMLTVQVAPHPVFGRDGDNLTDRPAGHLRRSRLGRNGVRANTGRETRSGSGSRPGRRTAACCGSRVVASRQGDSGDLLAKVQVAVPQRLTDDAREAVEALRADEVGRRTRAPSCTPGPAGLSG